MKSYSAYFVRNDDIDSVRQVFNKVEPIAGTGWLMCNLCKDDDPPDDDMLNGETSLTQERSEQLGEVIFVYGDTSMDTFAYEHAQNGELVRKLVWFQGPDGDGTLEWLCADGEPEPWEAALFRSDNLERLIERERSHYQDNGRLAEFAAREAELRQHWATGRISVGRTYPDCDGTAALLVEKSFGINRGW
ncbi:MAG: hypothetical protein U0105_28115 [Candidatus Obscuribacterales bacterium]